MSTPSIEAISLLEVSPHNWWCLGFWAFICSFIIRIINSLLSAFYIPLDASGRGGYFSIDRPDLEKRFIENITGKYDGFHTFFVGGLEIIAYSLFLKANVPIYIGAWLLFKTVNRMTYAEGFKRGVFNRYLLANGMVLYTAYILALHQY